MRVALASIIAYGSSLLGAAPARAEASTTGRSAAATRNVACAQLSHLPSGAVDWIVVVDAVPAENELYANRVFSFSQSACTPTIDSLRYLLAHLPITKAGQDTSATPMADSIVKLLRANAPELMRETSHRWVSRTGDRIAVFVLREPNVQPKITFAEASRTTRIETDLTTLVGLVAKLPVVGLDAGKDTSHAKYAYSVKAYALELDRATLKVGVTTAAAKPPKSSATPAKTDDAAKPVPPTKNADTTSGAASNDGMSVTILTGPREHLFLSADAGVSSAKQVSYDETSRALSPAKTPKQFYLAANYALSDLYQDTGYGAFARTLGSTYLGLLLEGSTKPFNQVGVVLGLRYVPFISSLLSFDTVSPYAGVEWARNESLANSAPAQEIRAGYGKGHVIAGLSLNLSKAQGWLSAGASKDATPASAK